MVAGARRVKAAGAGHSFTDIACTDGVMLDLSRMNRVLGVDGELVTVQAGMTIRELGPQLAERGLAVTHVDATVVMERPKLAPYRDAIRAALADGLGVAPEHVNVKASTGEGMGFVGRGEGIACIAVASVESE